VLVNPLKKALQELNNLFMLVICRVLSFALSVSYSLYECQIKVKKSEKPLAQAFTPILITKPSVTSEERELCAFARPSLPFHLDASSAFEVCPNNRAALACRRWPWTGPWQYMYVGDRNLLKSASLLKIKPGFIGFL